jgi:hypothetical protein
LGRYLRSNARFVLLLSCEVLRRRGRCAYNDANQAAMEDRKRQGYS